MGVYVASLYLLKKEVKKMRADTCLCVVSARVFWARSGVYARTGCDANASSACLNEGRETLLALSPKRMKSPGSPPLSLLPPGFPTLFTMRVNDSPPRLTSIDIERSSWVPGELWERENSWSMAKPYTLCLDLTLRPSTLGKIFRTSVLTAISCLLSALPCPLMKELTQVKHTTKARATF